MPRPLLWALGSGVEIHDQWDNDVQVPSFAAAFDYFPEGVVVCERLPPTGPEHGSPYRIVYVNAAFTALSGWTWSDLVGRRPPPLHMPGSTRSEEQRLHSALVRGDPVDAHLQFSRRNGTRYDANLRVSPVLDDAGRQRYLVCVFREVEPDASGYKALVESTLAAVLVTDPVGTVRWQSDPAARLLGVLHGMPLADLVHPDDRRALITAFATAGALPGARPPTEARMRSGPGFRSTELVFVNLLDDPAIRGIAVWARDVHEYRRAVTLLQGQRTVLEDIARGAGSAETLPTLVRVVEAHAAGAVCSVMRFDAATGRLFQIAGRGLPAAFNDAISAGIPIGPRAGSCGAAAFLGQPVISEDIAKDQLWDEIRSLALDNGLASCWSAPIVTSGDGRVLGTFAMYHREPRQPGSLDWELLRLASNLAGLALERDMDAVLPGRSLLRP